VIDPPWPLDNIGLSPKAMQHIGGNYERRPFLQKIPLKERMIDHYDTMTVKDIIEFPINDFADEEALLFLWVTCSKAENRAVLDIGFDLLKEWGFKYHTLITWSKGNSFAIWSPISRATEHCIFGYRGNFTKLTKKQNAVMKNHIHTNYQVKHSQKPPKFYQMLRAWTPKPRIDIFARQRHYGFDGWGDEYVGEGPLAEWLE
jgi:N6-adenosine-specific RNA methylase IME4